MLRIVEYQEDEGAKLCGGFTEHIKRIIQQMDTCPMPQSVRTAVVETLRLEAKQMLKTTGSAFDQPFYNALMGGNLGSSS
jgi:hypothetical protein